LEKVKKLTAILALGFVWAHRVGAWVALKKPIIFKNFKTQKRPQHSYFRYGLNCLDFARGINPRARSKGRAALLTPDNSPSLCSHGKPWGINLNFLREILQRNKEY